MSFRENVGRFLEEEVAKAKEKLDITRDFDEEMENRALQGYAYGVKSRLASLKRRHDKAKRKRSQTGKGKWSW